MTGLDKIKQNILDEAAEAAKASMDEVMAKARQIEEQNKADAEKKCAEISEKLRISDNTVRTHIARALKILRKQLTIFF